VRVCPFCGTENEVFFKFCLGCGADLDDALGSTAAEEAPAAELPAPLVASTAAVMPPAEESIEEPLPSTLVQHKPSTDTSHRPRVERRRETASRRLPAASGRLVLILEDGTDGAVYDLAPERTVIGREGADICFPHDDFLALRHAEFVFSGNQLVLTPLATTNGVFVQVSHEVELRNGDVFRIGQELLRFELLAEVIKAPFAGPDDAVRLGSPLHAVVMQREDRYFLKDLGSSNGTYYRLSRAMPLRRGALVLAGQQLFRVEH